MSICPNSDQLLPPLSHYSKELKREITKNSRSVKIIRCCHARDEIMLKIEIPTWFKCWWGACYFCDRNSQDHSNEDPLSLEFAVHEMNRIYDFIKWYFDKTYDAKDKVFINFFFSHPSIREPDFKLLLYFIRALKGNRDYKWISFARPEAWVIKYADDIKELNGVLSIGMEFFSEKDYLNKGLTQKDSIEVIKKLHKKTFAGLFMFSIPGTTPNDIVGNAAILAAAYHRFTFMNINKLYIKPNTTYDRYPERFGIEKIDGNKDFILSGVDNKQWNDIHRKFIYFFSDITGEKFNDFEYPFPRKRVRTETPIDRNLIVSKIHEYFDGYDFVIPDIIYDLI